jgi:hypothetical protein
VLALAFGVLWPSAPPLAAFVASALALASMVVANYQQLRVRITLADLGAI